MVSRSGVFLAVLLAASIAVADLPRVLPTPKKIAQLGGRVVLTEGNSRAATCIVAARPATPTVRAAIAEITDTVSRLGGPRLPVVDNVNDADRHDVRILLGVYADFERGEANVRDNVFASLTKLRNVESKEAYVVQCVPDESHHTILALGREDRGCYYAAATMAQLLASRGDRVELDRVEIVDWPTYNIRLIKKAAIKALSSLFVHRQYGT